MGVALLALLAGGASAQVGIRPEVPGITVHETRFDLLARGPVDGVFGQVAADEPAPILCGTVPRDDSSGQAWSDGTSAGLKVSGNPGGGVLDTSLGDGFNGGAQLAETTFFRAITVSETLHLSIFTEKPNNDNFPDDGLNGNSEAAAGWFLTDTDSNIFFGIGTIGNTFCQFPESVFGPFFFGTTANEWVVQHVQYPNLASGDMTPGLDSKKCAAFSPRQVPVAGEVNFTYSYDTGAFRFEFWTLETLPNGGHTAKRDEATPRGFYEGVTTARLPIQALYMYSSPGHTVDVSMSAIQVKYSGLPSAQGPKPCPAWTCGGGGNFDSCIRGPGSPPAPPAVPPEPPTSPRPPSPPPPISPPPPPSFPPPRPTRPPAYPGTKAAGDPHLFLAHGGKADFRGEDGALFAFLSAPDLALNVMTQNASFELQGQTVHGSFMTAAHVVATTAQGRTLRLSMAAERVLEMKGYNAHTAYANGTCSGRGDFDLYYRGTIGCDEIEMKMGYQELSLTTKQWRIRVQALDVFDRLAGPKHRLDIKLHLRVPEASLGYHPHGLIGQSYDGDDVAVSGKMDVYTPHGPEMTTTALAEGAIEGVAADYRVASKFDTAFRFSRFGAKVAPGGAADRPRDVSKLTGNKTRAGAASLTGGAGAE